MYTIAEQRSITYAFINVISSLRIANHAYGPFDLPWSALLWQEYLLYIQYVGNKKNMKIKKKTLKDLKKEAEKQVAEKSRLYEDVVYDVGIGNDKFLTKELMNRISRTSKQFEHLIKDGK